MKSKDDSSHKGPENEKKEDRSKKLGDKLGPAHNDRNQHQSKDLKKGPHPNQNQGKQDNRRQGNP